DAGNASTVSGNFAVTIDNTNPNAPVMTAVADDTAGPGGTTSDGLTEDTAPTLTITAEPGTTVEVFRDGTPVGVATEGPAGTFTFTSAALGDGDYVFTAVATDDAGNASSVSGNFAVTIDNTNPN